MTLIALLLVLTGSILHLGWNVMAKKAEDKLSFLWLANLPCFVAGLVVLTFLSFQDGVFSIPLVLCLIATSVVHAIYAYGLSSAYQFTDLSFVYPYCRGVGAVLATLGGVFLLGERPSTLGWIGIAFTVIATFIEPLTVRRTASSFNTQGLLFTLLTGLMIGAYWIVDKIGVQYLNPLCYLALMVVGINLCLGPIVLKRSRAIKEWKRARTRPLIASAFMVSSYGAVLYAMKMAPVTYVSSTRATGIVASGIAGMVFFNESPGWSRWGAILLISFGVFLISLA